MSKKKNKTELMPPAPAVETLTAPPDAPPAGGELPPDPPPPLLPPPPAVAAEVADLPVLVPPPPPPPDEPPAEEPDLAAVAPPEAFPAPALLAPAPLAPEPLAPDPPVNHAPPVAVVASPPMALPARALSVDELLERVRRLEDALAQVPAIEQRVAERVATRLQLERPAAPRSVREPGGLLGMGWLLPFARAAAPPAAIPVADTPAQRAWLALETMTEARAILCMYTDPRYRLTWLGRVVPPCLVAAFFTTGYWVPFSSLPLLGWLPERCAQLVVGFLLFKVLGHEARRYRQTAPDLPANLRL